MFFEYDKRSQCDGNITIYSLSIALLCLTAVFELPFAAALSLSDAAATATSPSGGVLPDDSD